MEKSISLACKLIQLEVEGLFRCADYKVVIQWFCVIFCSVTGENILEYVIVYFLQLIEYIEFNKKLKTIFVDRNIVLLKSQFDY